ncbi:MAG: trimeric intracellular cation channel family protein [Oscillospiraceae bacterium]|jgi:uncharacterized membrane protein YeiH|nr:trimeric intracellular cation channel family protein [Oscillospiraceae bacterium]MCI9588435.1 trimeric intracellular cation channel family protein [Oscillospiraceae bacterium]
MDTFILIVNLIGTVAFAASGAMIGLRKNMDIFGMCILGLTTATGGGVIRDLILGLTPPMAFRDPTSATVALVVSAVFFARRVRRLLMHNPEHYRILLFWMDALGLGAFTVIGVELAYQRAMEPTFFLLVFVGVVTGVGGGVIRDLLAQEVPYIFVKHVYACASLAGAMLCAGLWRWAGSMAAMLAGMATVVLIRVLAAHYHWNLPKAKQ